MSNTFEPNEIKPSNCIGSSPCDPTPPTSQIMVHFKLDHGSPKNDLGLAIISYNLQLLKGKMWLMAAFLPNIRKRAHAFIPRPKRNPRRYHSCASSSLFVDRIYVRVFFFINIIERIHPFNIIILLLLLLLLFINNKNVSFLSQTYLSMIRSINVIDYFQIIKLLGNN